MREKTINILRQAKAEGRAVGAFNSFNLEMTQAIVRAAVETAQPCIVQVTTTSFGYAGIPTLGEVVETVIKRESAEVPIGFHLDHGKTFEDIVKAIEAGVDSVMIDASKKELAENIALTKQVVEYAHQRGVAVQAELGRVPSIGPDGRSVESWEEIMTNPEEAKSLVVATGVDALAVGIGNAHGFFPEREEPDWARLEEIRKQIPGIPLIIHGASDWDRTKVEEAIKRGITCFNVDTDLRLTFIEASCRQLGPDCDLTDPRTALGAARQAVQEKVQEKILLYKLAE